MTVFERSGIALQVTGYAFPTARGTLDNHILPVLGELSVSEVGTAEVEALHYSLRATPRAANAMLKVLSKMFTLAEAWGVAAPRGNPCRHVIRYKEGKRERFLAPDEYRRVGRALRELEAEGRKEARAAAALRLVMLTGCRGGEIVTLRWDDIDRKAGEIRLRDGKTGARMVALTPEAAAVLAKVRRVKGSPWVFPGRPPDKAVTSLHVYWHRVRERARVEDVRNDRQAGEQAHPRPAGVVGTSRSRRGRDPVHRQPAGGRARDGSAGPEGMAHDRSGNPSPAIRHVHRPGHHTGHGEGGTRGRDRGDRPRDLPNRTAMAGIGEPGGQLTGRALGEIERSRTLRADLPRPNSFSVGNLGHPIRPASELLAPGPVDRDGWFGVG